jgi:DNA-binding transcriptional ArsR family regulator
VGAFEALADPVRRRLMHLLAAGEQPAGALVRQARAEFGISQPAVSQHLRVLRESGLVSVRAEGARRLYRVQPSGLAELEAWLDPFRTGWQGPLEALATELARGRRRNRRQSAPSPDLPSVLSSGVDEGDPAWRGAAC